MVALNRIYTRTGDQGTTGLASGERRPKYDLRIEAYGTVDETNACLGLARLHTADHAVDPMLAAAAGRLAAAVRAEDRLARLGGDEFVIVLAQADHAEIIVEELFARFEVLAAEGDGLGLALPPR